MTVNRVFSKLFFCFIFLTLNVQGNSVGKTVRAALSEHNRLVKEGHLKEAVACLSNLLQSGAPLTPKERLGVNNNLGILHKNLEQYDLALKYYDAAESVYLDNVFDDNSNLMSIYGNKVNIYSIKGDYSKALEYAEKAIRSVPESKGTILFKQKTLSSLLLNEGIIYCQLNDFDKALAVFNKSISLKNIYHLTGKENVYMHLANTYAKMGKNLLADRYFNLSIQQSEIEKINITSKVVGIYIQYASFLLSIHENSKAFSVIEKALVMNLSDVGEKNLLTANCYQVMGDYYQAIKEYPKALTYYQKALISGSKNFNDPAMGANPSITDIAMDLWQLRVLRGKAEVLAFLAATETDRNIKADYLRAVLSACDLAIEMTNAIRIDYRDEETRLIFGEKQKNVFVTSIESALKLYDLTSDKQHLFLAYQITRQYKAYELKFEITRNNSLYNSEIPDSLRQNEKELKREIAAYNALVRNEYTLPVPDTMKIAYWKDQQFDLNRMLEKKVAQIELNYPRFTDKIKKGNILSIETIQSSLKDDENLIEYVISEKDENSNRKLYAFVITRHGLEYYTQMLSSHQWCNLSGINARLISQFTGSNNLEQYNKMNRHLYEAYTLLIQPIEKYFTGKELIIIPDDGISYLPFDAFITSYSEKSKINYAELAYLIRDYSISYSYSTNTMWSTNQAAKIRPTFIGFAPDYSDPAFPDHEKYRSLNSNSTEIEGILNYFSGTVLKSGQATISNFRSGMNKGSILHLAMHAELDTVQNGSSGLIFAPDIQNEGKFRLQNHEIGQMNINSPLVVLSACNTGNGKLYNGEGLMSLARNFVLAGVPSVVETLWPVEDVAGARIMEQFYKHLAEGKPKNTALRLAKLDYINNTSPSFVNPGYWAAYTLMGDVSPIKKLWWKEPWILITLVLSISMLAIIIYRLRFLRIT